MKTKVLVTGSNSGLGRHLCEIFDALGWDIDTPESKKKAIKKKGVDIIIHCAFNSAREVTSDNLYQYFSDNVFLTKEIVNISHKKFIFISTVDIYPKDNRFHDEDEVIDLSKTEGMYPVTKLLSELTVKNHSKNYLILRCAAMLGVYSRKNSLIKLIEDEKPELTLTADSSFNYVLHTDVGEFIKNAIEEDLRGVYNLTSNGDVKLSDVVKLLKKKAKFGKFKYSGGKVNNKKALVIFPALKKNSKQVIEEFIQLLYKK